MLLDVHLAIRDILTRRRQARDLDLRQLRDKYHPPDALTTGDAHNWAAPLRASVEEASGRQAGPVCRHVAASRRRGRLDQLACPLLAARFINLRQLIIWARSVGETRDELTTIDVTCYGFAEFDGPQTQDDPSPPGAA